MSVYYNLDEEVCDSMTWRNIMRHDLRRIVGNDTFPDGNRTIAVITSFLGLVFELPKTEPPMLYDTQVIDGTGRLARHAKYPTRAAAWLGHQRICTELGETYKLDESFEG